MPPWLSQIRTAQRKESKYGISRWVQLATIGVDSNPRVRTVVFRGWSQSYEMEIYTDKRSQKYFELDLNNNVEICWLFSRSKCQFRLRGTSTLELGKDNKRHWDQLSHSSKSLWSWPRPGDHFIVDKKKDLSDLNMDAVSDNFALLKIAITQVDQLLIQKPIHMRRRWIRKNDWIEERINP